MEIIPTGIIVLALWLYFATRGTERALAFSLCMLPFGMLSVVNLPAIGGLSLQASSVCVALVIGWMLLRFITDRQQSPLLYQLGPAECSLIAFGLYAVVSATVNVRIFEGEFKVFSLSRAVERAGRGFAGMLTPLAPSAANLSQTFYLLLSIAFFFAVSAVIRRKGSEWMHRVLCAIAVIHLTLGLLDACALDTLLALVRTANYSLLTHQEIRGLSRVIGGFPEASAFGAYSVTLFAYFLNHYLYSKSFGSVVLAALLALCSIVSFSSTAYFGCFILAMLLLLGGLWKGLNGAGVPRCWIYFAAFGLGAAVLFLCFNAHEVEHVLDSLIFDKAKSHSGQERGLWASYGFKAFFDTYGLGAGVGSIRSNGWSAVYLGSVGIPGVLLFLVFLSNTLYPRSRGLASGANQIYRQSSRNAVLVGISMQLVSATTLDPGLLTMALIAFCYANSSLPNQEDQIGVQLPQSAEHV